MAQEGSAELSKQDEIIRKKERVSMDDLYRRSSQYSLWSFSSDSLQDARRKANEKGIQSSFARFNECHFHMQQELPELFEKFERELSSSALFQSLSLEEEQKYLNFYTKNIIQTADFFKMPTQVKATAIAFFKRFYLVNSVMNFHPKNILYTCVFLAAKSENYFISIESFCKSLPKTEPKDVLDLEFTVLQSLRFTLLVHHPFRPLYGFFLDFQAVLLHPSPLMYDVSVDILGSMYDKAKLWLNEFALLSDALFLYTPPQIALAAMYDTDKRITDKYLKKKFLKEQNEIESTSSTEQKQVDQDQEIEVNTKRDQYEAMVRIIRKCIKLAKQLSQSTREESTKIDKKCFFTLNPNRLIKKTANKLNSPTPA